MKKILSMVMVVICLIIAGTSTVMAKTLPPTSISDEELKELKAMTLDDLKAVAKPMPKDALTEQGSNIGYIDKFPNDGNIYSIIYKCSDGSIEEGYFKYLYVDIGPSNNMVTHYIYKWVWYKDKWWCNQKITWDDYDPELYAQLLKLDDDNNKDGDSRFPDPSDSDSNSNSSSGNTGVLSMQRIQGGTRIETAAAIAEKFNNGIVQAVVITTGDEFADALSGSTLAKKLNAPILLIGSGDNSPTYEYIKAHLDKQQGKIYILGGPGAVPDAFIKAFNDMGYLNIKRLSGQGRYETNQAINTELNAQEGTPIVLATGEDFPDALSISSIAAIKGYPIVLSGNDYLPQNSIDTIKSIKPGTVYIAGGHGVVSESVKNTIKSIAGLKDENIIRLSGQDRYETSLSIARHFNLDSNTVCFATGEDFPDALAGSVLAAKLNAPILLINDDPGELMKYIAGTKYSNRIIFGGPGAVSKTLEDALSK